MRAELNTITKYIADDGTVFDDEEKCLKYESIPKYYFKIICNPDLTEGRGYYGAYTVKVKNKPADMALPYVQDWCFSNLGSPITHIQGVSPIRNWIIYESNKETYEQGFYVTAGDYKYPSKKIEI